MLADRIAGGVLSSLNGNTEFNLNDGHLRMDNTEFLLGGGADIHFESYGNRLYYRLNDWAVGVGMGRSINDVYPLTFIGTSKSRRPNPVDDEDFTGFIANTLDRMSVDGIGNSVVGKRFDVRDKAVSFGEGFTFNLAGARKYLSPLNAGSIPYDLGTGSNYFRRAYINEIRVNESDIYVRNQHAISQGFSLMTGYQGESQMAFFGLNAHEHYYNLGKSNRRFSYVFLRYQPDVSSDRRLKEFIKDNTLGLDFIKDIETKSFKLINNNPNQSKEPTQLGVVAQQVIKVFEKHGVSIDDLNIISKGSDGYYGVQYTQFIPIIIKAIQELSNKIEVIEREGA